MYELDEYRKMTDLLDYLEDDEVISKNILPTDIKPRLRKKVCLHSGSMCVFRKSHLSLGYIRFDDAQKEKIVFNDNDNIERYSFVRLHSCNCCNHFTICKVRE